MTAAPVGVTTEQRAGNVSWLPRNIPLMLTRCFTFMLVGVLHLLDMRWTYRLGKRSTVCPFFTVRGDGTRSADRALPVGSKSV